VFWWLDGWELSKWWLCYVMNQVVLMMILVFLYVSGVNWSRMIVVKMSIVVILVVGAGFWWLVLCCKMIEIKFKWGKFIWRGRNEKFGDVEFIMWFLINSVLPLPKILNSWSFLPFFLCFCSGLAGLGKLLSLWLFCRFCSKPHWILPSSNGWWCNFASCWK